jgi:ribonuclease III
MSQLRLTDALQKLYLERNSDNISRCLNHEDFQSFQTRYQLKVPPENFVHAFTHTSFNHEYGLPHQELLEFLGDSVLQLILTEELFKLFPLESEGKLSKLRSSIVNEASLSKLARELKLGELILVGKGEFKKNLVEQNPVLADTFEALLGIVYRSQGLKFTSELFLGWLKTYLPTALNLNLLEDFDAKSKLQERSLAKFKKLPKYVSADASYGKFRVELWIDDKLLAEGEFLSKKTGEKELAQSVLKQGLI